MSPRLAEANRALVVLGALLNSYIQKECKTVGRKPYGRRQIGVSQTVFEIISVGNELLIGRVANTNVHWLVSNITGLGGFVRRSMTIRDDLDEISSVLRDSISRKTDWIIMSGGLGPTYDDMTLLGVARALGKELEVDDEAVAMIRERYERLKDQGILREFALTPARLKMATLPKGSVPLRNSAGTAPGVLVRGGNTSVVCLPGVPEEMKAIFEESLMPILDKNIIRMYSYSVTLYLSRIVESVLAPLLEKVLASEPGVYVKSHPRGVVNGVARIEVHIMGTASRVEEAKVRTVAASQMFSSLIEEANGTLDRIEEAEGHG